MADPAVDPLKTPIDPNAGYDPGKKDIDPGANPPAKKTVEQLEAELVALEKRRKDFQARADRAEAFAQHVSPILAAIEQDPEIQARLQHPDQEPDPMPKSPEKPASFDYIAAHNDPTSESFKWQQAQDKYVTAKLEWVDRREQQREKEKKEALQLSQRRQQMAAQMGETQTKLVSEMGFTPEESTHFVAWMSDDDNVTLENLVAFYRAVHRKAAPQAGGGPPRPPSYGPTPAAAAGGGGGHQEIDPNVAFNDSVRQNNPASKRTLFPRTASGQRK